MKRLLALGAAPGWLRAAAVLCLAVSATTGCDRLGEESLLSPQYAAGGSPDVNRIAVYAGGAPKLTIAWAKAWIGPQGGSVRLLDFEIVVPAGAVSRLTKFEIRLPVDAGAAEHAMAEFTPHNQAFGVPVTIRLPYRGTSAENATSSVLWWNGASWVRYPTTVLPDGRLETTTTHFSTYGTEEPSRGITPLGG